MVNEDQKDGLEDFDDDIGAESQQVPDDDFEKEGGVSSLKNNPLVKVGVILAGFAAIVVGLTLFGGKPPPETPSSVAPASDVKQAPGTGEISKAYEEAVKEKNTQQLEEAVKKGQSAIPTPVSTAVETLAAPDIKQEQEDPLERWRRVQEERNRREQNQMQQQGTALPGANPGAEAIDQLSKAMQAQMQTILDTQKPQAVKNEKIADLKYLKDMEKQAKEEALQDIEDAKEIKEQLAELNGETDPEELIAEIIQPAGTIEYAQLITEANTDAPGPVLAEIMSGPLKGSRILGTFAKQEDFLVLNFSTVVIDGVSTSAQAIALDPQTANPGIVTEIDRRYFSRIILPAAAAFVEGLGSAMAKSSSTTVTIKGETVAQDTEDLDTDQEIAKGIEEAASKTSELIDEKAGKIRPLIKVHAGTPIALLFTQPVIEQAQQGMSYAGGAER